MSFNPFGSFPGISHFAVNKFHQDHHHHQSVGNNFVAIPSHHQGIQIAVSTVDASQLNGHHHNQMLNSLLGTKQVPDVFVKLENPDLGLQDDNQLNEYLSRFSGPPTFPFQQMYKFNPADLMPTGSEQAESSSQSPQQTPQVQKKSKKKKKKQNNIGLPPPRRRSTSLQPAISTTSDGLTLFSCPQCNTLFNNREAIETHLAVHRSERPFICEDCGAALKRKEHLDRHRSSHMTERPHPCPVCSKTFKRIEHLQRHSIIHRTDKVHRCNECGKGFNRKDHLTKHIHSHLAKKVKQEIQVQQQQEPCLNGGNTSTMNQSILAHLH